MDKKTIQELERARLLEIFNDVDEKQKELVVTLIDEAAFLAGENSDLKSLLGQTGMVLIHPKNPMMQKPTPSATQYLKNLNSYNAVIKTLATILNRQPPEDEDNDLEDYE